MSDKPRDQSLPTGLSMRLSEVSSLNPSDRDLLLRAGQIVPLKKNDTLFNQGSPADSFFLVLSGFVKLQQAGPAEHKELNPILMDLVGPGELIAVPLMKTPETVSFPISAIALNPSEVLSLSKDFYVRHWQHNSSLMKLSDQQLQKRLGSIQRDRQLQWCTLEQKLAYFLIEKIAPHPGIKLTRQDIANSIGASTEAVIRTLSEWSKQGVVSTHSQEITIHDTQYLQNIWSKPT